MLDDQRAAAVQIEQLQFAWTRGGPQILDIESFAVAAGRRVFMQGPSGSGKSTLLCLIGGVAEAQSGRISVLGTDLSALPRSRRDSFRADHIGFVFQLFNLVPYLSMLENVALPCRFSRRRRERAVRAAGDVESEARRLLNALELDQAQLLNRQVTDLSIGQQQRVAVARALIGAPDLVIADEPTSALDEGTREAFLALLFRECEAQGTSLIFVSHDPRLAPWFDEQCSLPEINKASRSGNPPGAA